MIIIIFCTCLFVIAFYKKGRMDKSAKGGFTYYDSDKYKNKSKSWGNKYFQPLEKYKPKWYYLGIIKPLYKERFPFSTTSLVFLTDYWHLNQFLFLNYMFIGFTILAVNIEEFILFFNIKSNVVLFLYIFLLLKICYMIGFNWGYEKKN